jgi:sugar O-acyltransferase (sialic acid O-acetyltransferase NeuD family)
MSRVLVIGGAEQGRQVMDAIAAGGEHRVVGILDRSMPAGSVVGSTPVLGTNDDLARAAEESGAEGYVVAIGDNFVRGRLLTHAVSTCPHLAPVTVVHPSAWVAADASIGDGSIVLAGAIVSNACRVNRGVLLCTRASLDHDNTVGEFASLAPGVTLGGSVRIGTTTAIGLGANVIHGITIGAHSVVGAGALVLEDVPDLVVAYGAPARVIREREAGDPYLRRRALESVPDPADPEPAA